MIKKLAEAERKSQTLSEENANLMLELNLRPSSKHVHGLQRQVQALQRQLARSKARCQDHDDSMPAPEESTLGKLPQSYNLALLSPDLSARLKLLPLSCRDQVHPCTYIQTSRAKLIQVPQHA